MEIFGFLLFIVALLMVAYSIKTICKVKKQVTEKLTLDNDTFENTGKSRFFERRTSRVLY